MNICTNYCSATDEELCAVEEGGESDLLLLARLPSVLVLLDNQPASEYHKHNNIHITTKQLATISQGRHKTGQPMGKE